ncbi:hypothetical protein C7412_12795 [Paraburkholderia silvatlantica]|nr:hypothetical protein C7412_12795 [Paraburkholderia silvatlantica]
MREEKQYEQRLDGGKYLCVHRPASSVTMRLREGNLFICERRELAKINYLPCMILTFFRNFLIVFPEKSDKHQ